MSSQPPAQERAPHQAPSLSSLSTTQAWFALALLYLAALARALASGGRKSVSTGSPPTRPGPSVQLDSHSECSLKEENHRCPRSSKELDNETNKRRLISINMLPDDALLEIFDLYVVGARSIQGWQSLVHVCRRWRTVVFGSPNRLNLRLICSQKTPARDRLDVWPPFPLLIICRKTSSLQEGFDNIISVLERRDRVREISLMEVSSSQLETLSAAMQVPFPELTSLDLWSFGGEVLPGSFLGGSAPHLRILRLYRIPFPGLPKLLLSATHLVKLQLLEMPHSGYIPPEAMFTVLSTLTRLQDFMLEFQSPLSRPNRATRRLPPPTRCVLSVLMYFWFKGDSEYLDDLVAYSDAPRLNSLHIIFFNQIVFDTPQLIQFICRTPKLKALEEARVSFGDRAARVKLLSILPRKIGDDLNVEIPCRELDWQISSVEQVFTSSLPPLSTLEHLYIYETLYFPPHWQDNIENALWLELLHPFRAVKKLYISEEFAPHIVPALQELVVGRATEVLPALKNIFLEGLQLSGPIQDGIRQFVATRQIAGHSIAVTRWDRDKRKFY